MNDTDHADDIVHAHDGGDDDHDAHDHDDNAENDDCGNTDGADDAHVDVAGNQITIMLR